MTKVHRAGSAADTFTEDAVTYRSVRLSGDETDALLDELDARDTQMRKTLNARRRTFPYRHRNINLVLNQGQNTRTKYRAPTRAISAEYICLLHGGYVHARTQCDIQLITTHNTWQDESGSVSNCTHLRKGIHEVTIHFDDAITVALYARNATKTRVLVVDDDAFIRRLTKLYLDELFVETEFASDGQEALGKTTSGIFDVVLMDMNMPKMSGWDAVREIRTRGYTGRIVAVTAMTGDRDREKCLKAGCDAYTSKPITRELIERLLNESKEEPLFSSFASDPAMANLIDEYVRAMPVQVRAIETALAAGNLPKLMTCCQLMSSSGGSYGFDPISHAAGHVAKMIESGVSVESLKSGVDALTKWCVQVRSSTHR